MDGRSDLLDAKQVEREEKEVAMVLQHLRLENKMHIAYKKSVIALWEIQLPKIVIIIS